MWGVERTTTQTQLNQNEDDKEERLGYITLERNFPTNKVVWLLVAVDLHRAYRTIIVH